ncbi:NAD(P)H-dependent glycerol-3-phosphate dehydrogenase [uncultured Roseovarius sp.]|uniref:NAD(P)H-dependent glycerol-3-phosphate dehydrogenase n=1 Tax=uncultured Roseovarius sp. TaxID=293344 RepID=UPI0026367310|nr:NAD(P)H-dependent glycerol-3-phosphate dehydrogenase [uncultured Roseovarius sp.]
MIYVFGSGAFGTAMAISLAGKVSVTLWSRSVKQVLEMQKTRENRQRLPGVTLPSALMPTEDFPEMSSNAICLLAVPTQKLRGFLAEHADAFANCQLVACCKGIEHGTGFGPTQIIAELVPSAVPSMLTGPSFAQDIARGLPTALTLACADSDAGEELQIALTTPNLRIYRTTDTIGAELGGALKNVVAIACGAAIGAGLGESARAALMTRGFSEMSRMAATLGADADTLAGLSGFGDLTLTCTSDQSRNYRFGLSLGRNDEFDPNVTVEGATTASAVLDRAEEIQIDMPITKVVVALIDGKLRVEQAMDMLLSRPLKEE